MIIGDDDEVRSGLTDRWMRSPCSKLKGSSVKGYEIEANNISHYYVNYFCLMEKEGK